MLSVNQSLRFFNQLCLQNNFRNSPLMVFLEKGVLKKCSKFTGEHPYQSMISIRFQSNFIEITLRHRRSPVNFLHIFRTPFLQNTSGLLQLGHSAWFFKGWYRMKVIWKFLVLNQYNLFEWKFTIDK